MAHMDWFIALVDAGEAYDPAVHARRDPPRRDLAVKAITIEESENAARARVSIILTHFTRAVLGSGAKRWMYLSREIADGSVVLMATGRLVGVPLRGETNGGYPTLEFECSPDDWDTREAAAVAPYAVLPYFDPVIVDQARSGDTKEILDGYFATVHCHRATHAFSVVDKFGVGLPTIICSTARIDPLPSSHRVDTAVAMVQVRLSVEFVQQLDAVYDVSSDIKSAFPHGFIDTMTPEQFESSWPAAGADANGSSGWTRIVSTLKRINRTDWPSPFAAGVTPQWSMGSFISPPDKRHDTTYYSWVNDKRQTQHYDVVQDNGSSVRRYTYLDSGNNATDPGGIHGTKTYFDRAYYDCEVVYATSIRQRRIETIRFDVVNGAQPIAPGPIKKLVLKCEDVTVDRASTGFVSDYDYTDGDTIRVAGKTYQCKADHRSASTWAGDQTRTLPGGAIETLWQELPEDLSPMQDRARASYFQYSRGEQTFQAAICKARRILAESTRNVEVTIKEYLTDDKLALTTAARASIVVPDDILDNGGCEAKVTAYKMYSDARTEYIDITVRAATGSGAEVGGSPTGNVNVTGEAWDNISYDDYLTSPPSLPPIGAAVVVENDAESQSDYISEHDYVWNDDERNDSRENDPENLLQKVKTKIVVNLTQTNSLPTLELETNPQHLFAWAGPRQYDVEV